MATRYKWQTVQKTSADLGISRWDVLMRALHDDLKYRATAHGIELRADSVDEYKESLEASHA